jgi:hypothetical protein
MGPVPVENLNRISQITDKQTKVNTISSHSWRDHFKIDQSVVEAFWEFFSQSSPILAAETNPSEAPNSIEFILWCIERGLFTESAFIQWQSEIFEIPAVKPAFFEAPVDHAFWDRVKEIHAWTPACMPLAEWDDVLLVAVVSSTLSQSLSLSKRHRVVLAAPSLLIRQFEKLAQPSMALEPPPHPDKIPSRSAALTPIIEDDNSGDPFAALSRELGITNPSGSEEKPGLPEMEASSNAEPEGLVLPDGLVLSESLNPETLEKEIATGAQTEDSNGNSILTSGDSLVHNFETGESEATKKPYLENAPPVQPLQPIQSVKASEPIEDDPLANLTMSTTAKATGAAVQNEVDDPAKTVPISAPKLNLQISDTQIGSHSGTFSGTQTKSRRLESPPVTSVLGSAKINLRQDQPDANPENSTLLNKSVAIGKLAPIHLDQCRSIDEAGAQAILQACNIYDCAMILLFRGGDLLPWKWNDLFLSVKGEKPDPIDLAEPSIFKIVFRTAKPYHGYIVTSDVNQKFFNAFFRGQLPKHATVIPLMMEGRMAGMMLGLTNSKIDYRQSLRLMERLTFDLARVFKSLRGTMAKAS